MQIESLPEIIDQLIAEPITSDDETASFVFMNEIRHKKIKAPIGSKRLLFKREKEKDDEGYYKVEEMRSEDGVWLLELYFNGSSTTIPFFAIDEAIDELKSFDLSGDSN